MRTNIPVCLSVCLRDTSAIPMLRRYHFSLSLKNFSFFLDIAPLFYDVVLMCRCVVVVVAV